MDLSVVTEFLQHWNNESTSGQCCVNTCQRSVNISRRDAGEQFFTPETNNGLSKLNCSEVQSRAHKLKLQQYT